MELTFKSTSTKIFIQRLIGLMSYFDLIIFKKPARFMLETNKGQYPEQAAFRVLKLFGLFFNRHAYFISFKENSELIEKENRAITLAVHELRHRYQYYFPKCLISIEFAKKLIDKRKLPKETINYIIEHLEKGGYKKDDYNKEFDARIVELITSFHSNKINLGKIKPLTEKFVIQLITCNEENFENLLG